MTSPGGPLERSSERAVPEVKTDAWQKRFFMALTMLAWITIGGIIIWCLSLIPLPLALVILSLLLAFLFYPVVTWFERFVPRGFAVILTLLLILGVICLVLYLLVVAVAQQVSALVLALQAYRQHVAPSATVQQELSVLQLLGVSQDNLQRSAQVLLTAVQKLFGTLFPLVASLFSMIIIGLILLSFTAYLLLDGPRMLDWLRSRTPHSQRRRITYVLDVTGRRLGGFVRGGVLLAALGATCDGSLAFLLHVPFPVLIIMIVFLCGFIPQIGAYISGPISIMFALTQGWQTALIFAVLSATFQAIVIGQILTPRIMGRAVGIHPLLSLFALLVGGTLFGLLGALLACPVAGIAQTFVSAVWSAWSKDHPEEFDDQPTTEEQPSGQKTVGEQQVEAV